MGAVLAVNVPLRPMVEKTLALINILEDFALMEASCAIIRIFQECPDIRLPPMSVRKNTRKLRISDRSCERLVTNLMSRMRFFMMCKRAESVVTVDRFKNRAALLRFANGK